MPAALNFIGRWAFYGCTGLIRADLSAATGLTSLSGWAFLGCTILTEVILPEGLTSIDNNAFQNCSSLTGIILPASLTSIGAGAFFGCSSLTEITLPASLISIGGGAFIECTNLAIMTSLNPTPPTHNGLEGWFGNTHPNLRIEVPAGNANAYRTAFGWNENDTRNRIHSIGCTLPNAEEGGQCSCT